MRKTKQWVERMHGFGLVRLRMRRRGAALLGCAIALTGFGVAERAGALPAGSLRVVPNVRIWGADISAGLRTPPLLGPALGPAETWLWAHLGGGWQDKHLYRRFSAADAVIGEPMGEEETGDPTLYRNLTFDAQLALQQGLLYSAGLQRNIVDVTVMSRFRWDHHYQNKAESSSFLADSSVRDRAGLFAASLFAALRYDGIRRDQGGSSLQGAAGEFSVDWAPVALSSEGSSYLRLNVQARGFLTPVRRRHFTLTVGSRLVGDVVFPTDASRSLEAVPAFVRSSVGGLNEYGFGVESAPGGAVRGVAGGRFDGRLKLVANTDVRFLFPALLPVDIYPGVILFADWGASDFRRLDLRLSGFSDQMVTAGAGLLAHILVADLIVYVTYCFQPSEAQGLDWEVRFSRQF